MNPKLNIYLLRTYPFVDNPKYHNKLILVIHFKRVQVVFIYKSDNY